MAEEMETTNMNTETTNEEVEQQNTEVTNEGAEQTNENGNGTTTNEQASESSGNNASEDDRKLFVGGLPQDAQEGHIRSYFEQFGSVDAVNLKTDMNTGRSRGFAFVVFKEESSCIAAHEKGEHTINKKKVAVKRAQAKQGKIYVGKLVPELTDERVKEFFSSYGTIIGIEQPFDKSKNERKNFCFITYEREDTANSLLKEGAVTVDGHSLDVKKVTPKLPTPMGGFRGGRGGSRGYMGGNWGDYEGNWGGYGDYWGYGPPDYGYGFNMMGGDNWGYGGGYGVGGKTPRGRGATRGRGRGQRQKPY